MPPSSYPGKIRDTQLKVSKVLPAANANNNTDPIDLIADNPGINARGYEAEIVVDVLPSLVDTKKVTVTVQDSADGTNFAAIPELATVVLTGAGGVGAAAVTRTVKLPQTVRRYIRLNTAVEAAGGDNTAKSVALSIVF
ncbi:hypothetical protein [Verrucomicrobium spinosum]|uniref:hypothetical protein n=1 Tax=Verrucomicrobium spinosum TaxID=2736 RepID=UPI00017465E5|nr:hypothetical protein [Verrucomicrobium spinosum]